MELTFFDLISDLHYFFRTGKKDQYKIALATLDILNHNHKIQTGSHYMEPFEVLNFYSKLWEF